MFGKLWLIRDNDFMRHNAVFFIGSMAVAVVNYLYYPVVGRLVSTAQFGEVQALVSLNLQIGLLLSVLADVTVNVVANAKAGDESDRLVVEFEWFATLLIVVLVGLALLFVQPLKHFLHFDAVVPFAIAGIALILNASSTMRAAYLRGKNAYGRLSVSSLLGSVSKLVGSLVLVLIGFGTAGAIGGLLVSGVVVVTYNRLSTYRLGLRAPKKRALQLPDMRLIRPQLPFATLVFIVSVVTTALFSVDVVLAKHFFSPQLAGEYAGIATIGRVIYFVTGSVATVLLSSLRLDASASQNRKVFLRSLYLTVGLGGVALLAFALFPRFFIHVLIGSRYLPLAGLLPKLSLTLFLISIVNLVFSYDVALRRWSIAWISVIGAGITIVLMVLNHATPSHMIDSLLLGSVILLGLRALDSLRRNGPLRRQP